MRLGQVARLLVRWLGTAKVAVSSRNPRATSARASSARQIPAAVGLRLGARSQLRRAEGAPIAPNSCPQDTAPSKFLRETLLGCLALVAKVSGVEGLLRRRPE